MTKQETEEKKQVEYFLPPEEVEECYGANFAEKLLIHQKEIFQDWYSWKRGKGKGLLVKRWMGEDTSASDSEEETNGLSHRFFEDLHMFASLKMINAQHKISTVSKKAKQNKLYQKWINRKNNELEEDVEDCDQDIEPLTQNRIMMLNIPLSDEEWKNLSHQNEVNDLSLRAAIQVTLEIDPDKVQEMYDLCAYRILNDANLVYQAFAVGIFGFTLPLYLLNTIENPTIAATVWFAARSLYSGTLGKDAFKRIHTAGDNDWSIVNLLNSIVEDNNLNGDLGLSPDGMKSAYEGYGRIDWIWGNWPLAASMLGMLASGSFEQLAGALSAVVGIKAAFKKVENNSAKKSAKNGSKIEIENSEDAEEIAVDGEPFYAKSLVESRKGVEGKRKISRFQTFLTVLFNDTTYLLGGIIAAISKKSALSTLAGITTVGRLMVQRQLKEVNKEENIAVWRNFNKALEKLNRRLDKPIEKNIKNSLTSIFTGEGASFIEDSFEIVGDSHREIVRAFADIMNNMTDGYILGLSGYSVSTLRESFDMRRRSFNGSVQALIKAITRAAELFDKESLQAEFRELGFSDLLCDSCLVLNNTGLENFFFIFLELKKLIFEEFVKSKVLNSNDHSPIKVRFNDNDRNDLIDFILERISVSFFNQTFTDEQLVSLTESLFKTHPSYEEVLSIVKKKREAKLPYVDLFSEITEVCGQIKIIFNLNVDDHFKLTSILDEKGRAYAGEDIDNSLSLLMDYAKQVMKDWGKEQLDIAFLDEALVVHDEFYKKYNLSFLKKDELLKALLEIANNYTGESNQKVLLKLKIYAEKLMVDWDKEEVVEAV